MSCEFWLSLLGFIIFGLNSLVYYKSRLFNINTHTYMILIITVTEHITTTFYFNKLTCKIPTQSKKHPKLKLG